jgi:hypothetical protein
MFNRMLLFASDLAANPVRLRLILFTVVVLVILASLMLAPATPMLACSGNGAGGPCPTP